MKALLMLTMLISAGSFSQALNNEDLKKQALADWQRAKVYTKEYLDAMPEKGMSFKPTSKARTFAEQMLHLAQTNYLMGANGTGEKPLFADIDLEKSEELKTKQALSKTVMESYDFVINGIRKIDASKLDNKVPMEGFKKTSLTRLDWLNKALEYQTHHRGKTAPYLRLMGVEPPPEKLF